MAAGLAMKGRKKPNSMVEKLRASQIAKAWKPISKMTPAPRLILTPFEKATPIWGRLFQDWQTRLEQLRSKLEGDITEVEAAKLRGRIAEIRANLSLDNEVPAAPE